MFYSKTKMAERSLAQSQSVINFITETEELIQQAEMTQDAGEGLMLLTDAQEKIADRIKTSKEAARAYGDKRTQWGWRMMSPAIAVIAAGSLFSFLPVALALVGVAAIFGGAALAVIGENIRNKETGRLSPALRELEKLVATVGSLIDTVKAEHVHELLASNRFDDVTRKFPDLRDAFIEVVRKQRLQNGPGSAIVVEAKAVHKSL